MSWDQQFFDPIELPKGKTLVTLRDAATYITKLPKAEHDAEEWQAAMEALLLVAESGGPTMFAPDRRDAGAQSSRRAGVQPGPEGKALGTAQASAGSMIDDQSEQFDPGFGVWHFSTSSSTPTSHHGQTYSSHQSLVRFGRYAETTGTCFRAVTFCQTNEIIPDGERGQASVGHQSMD